MQLKTSSQKRYSNRQKYTFLHLSTLFMMHEDPKTEKEDWKAIFLNITITYIPINITYLLL